MFQLHRIFTLLIAIWAILGYCNSKNCPATSAGHLIDLTASEEVDCLLPMVEDMHEEKILVIEAYNKEKAGTINPLE